MKARARRRASSRFGLRKGAQSEAPRLSTPQRRGHQTVSSFHWLVRISLGRRSPPWAVRADACSREGGVTKAWSSSLFVRKAGSPSRAHEARRDGQSHAPPRLVIASARPAERAPHIFFAMRRVRRLGGDGEKDHSIRSLDIPGKKTITHRAFLQRSSRLCFGTIFVRK